jgi:hypothetical protein
MLLNSCCCHVALKLFFKFLPEEDLANHHQKRFCNKRGRTAMATEQQIERAASRQDWMQVLGLDPTTAVTAAEVKAVAAELLAKFIWSKELCKCIRDAASAIIVEDEKSIAKCRYDSLILSGMSKIIAQFIVRPDHALYMTSFIPSAQTQPIEHQSGVARIQIRPETPPRAQISTQKGPTSSVITSATFSAFN